MGIVKHDGGLTFYDGKLRIVDAPARSWRRSRPGRYFDFMGEKVEPWSYLEIELTTSQRDFRRGFTGLDRWPV